MGYGTGASGASWGMGLEHQGSSEAWYWWSIGLVGHGTGGYGTGGYGTGGVWDWSGMGLVGTGMVEYGTGGTWDW